ncbi:hypothetical protein MSG28_002957 [Choristoneura fumiferana]|uniref:Uncharacterized protein n=1 Tax=Choristoneura fumiferana TaxID=7141 RepID=A0ACC0JKD2_CHOFU|nr:hypothetical protein MSG28_002957 [Choristoneura fumiferana]
MLRVLVLSSIFIFGDASFVSSLPKCSVRDNECQRELLQTVISSIGKTGVKELGIPPIDPLELKNVSVSVADLLDITLVDGVVKGVKDCEIHKMVTDVESGISSMDLTCDITVKGHYKATSSSPLVKSLFGGDFVRGDGFGKVKVEKIRLHIEFKLKVTKDAKGEVYLAGDDGQIKSKFEILGNLVFAADNIFLGNEDVSDVVVRMLNENGKSFAPFFGGPFMEKTGEFVYNITGKFFKVVPARFYIKEDLSEYVTE